MVELTHQLEGIYLLPSMPNTKISNYGMCHDLQLATHKRGETEIGNCPF